MKSWVMSILILTGAASLIAAPAAGSENSLRGVELKACRPDGRVCLTATSAKTEGSQLKALHRLTEPVVRIQNRATGKVMEEKAKFGYVDIEANQLVLQKIETSGAVTEISWDLKTLKRLETRFR